jgi:hypothetical protein
MKLVCTNCHGWEQTWRQVLAQSASSEIVLLDLDTTIFDPDAIQEGVMHCGEVDSATGKKVWVLMDEDFKRQGSTILMGDLLEHGLCREVLRHWGHWDDYLEWLKLRHFLVPGFRDLLFLFHSYGVQPIGITNGAYQLASSLLQHHDVEFPIAANWLCLEGGSAHMHFFHGRRVGIDKGLLAAAARRWGYTVLGCGGDSKGDITLAAETAAQDGFVLARRGLGLAKWCDDNIPGTAIEYDDFYEVLGPVQQHLESRGMLPVEVPEYA